ncbi:hypothetical protein Srubr_72700 [Streptomyces rubradiris]|uniref:Uncharacterized protein n=1 Tax=Streptomyces rubradiris TaxID=285531 RepID=A0ABQ3RNJ7_STRRR|nr:hypothetical protein GCM10018792_39490 [Streptomyces rubradiris]GHI57424.1 hypothetical protein Srubr_72700 [Streptomyces rubradiris]
MNFEFALRPDRCAASYGHPPYGRDRKLPPVPGRAVRVIADLLIGGGYCFSYARFTDDFAGLGESGARRAALDADGF